MLPRLALAGLLMSIRGSVKTMSLLDVLDWLERRGLAGALSTSRGPLTRRLQVAGGQLTAASSTNPVEYLGQLLLNRELLSEDQLRAIYAQLPARKQSLGTALVADGVVGEATLREAITEKIKESVFDCLAWPDGSFEFEPDARTTQGEEVAVAVPLRACLVEGESRAAEWRRVREVIARDDMRFFAVEAGPPPDDERQARLLADVRRGLTAADMMLEHHSLPFPILRDLAAMIGRGLVRADRRASLRPPPGQQTPQGLIAAAEARARGNDRAGALALAKRALEAAPEDDQVKRGYAAVERVVFAELSRALLTRFRVPRLARPSDELAALPLSSEERYFIGRIDGRWDLLSLLRVAPLREVESLLTLEGLAARGLITLE